MIKKKPYITLVFFIVGIFFNSFCLKAQSEIEDDFEENEKDEISGPATYLRPYLGLGTGMIAYYGDVRNTGLSRTPFTSRVSSELYLGTELNNYLNLDFYFLFGKLAGNEFGNQRNLNFQSTIRSGGFLLTYDFENFYKTRKPKLQPFISVGFESVEYLTKTDLFDSQGREYNYWSDGSIRSLPENHPNAALSEELVRNYVYETDVRELDLDGFGTYNDQTFAIPIGGGFRMNLTDRLSFRVSSIAHIAFTNMIDGITEESAGNRQGNSKRDWYLVNSASISYNLHFPIKRKTKPSEYKDIDLDDVDYLALMNEDSDGDGVRDFDDLCPDTPPGVEVDKDGCPIDSDDDGIPDYRDDEPNSAPGAIVNRRGVTMTEEEILAAYKLYSDSVGAFAVTTRTLYQTALKDPDMPTFKVQIGKFGATVPQNFINKVLSISDISSSKTDNDQTIYSVGRYSAIDAAKNRKEKMIEMGFTDVKIIVEKGGRIYAEDDSQFEQASKYTRQARPATSKAAYSASRASSQGDKATSSSSPAVPPTIMERAVRADKQMFDDAKPMPITDQLVYRVQIGTHSKKVTDGRYSNVPDLVSVTKEDGLTRYLGGSFNNYKQAADLKAQLMTKGYSDAFVVAYRNGERVNLQSITAEVTPAPDYVAPSTQMDKEKITFGVQIGAFRNPSAEFLNESRILEEVKMIALPNGIKKYVSGDFKKFNDAEKLRAFILSNTSFTDAFIISFYDGKQISLQQAMQVLNQ